MDVRIALLCAGSLEMLFQYPPYRIDMLLPDTWAGKSGNYVGVGFSR